MENFEVRLMEERDIPKIMDLLVQVNLVHAKGRPDIFKENTKFSPEDVKNSFLGNKEQPVYVYVEKDAEGREEVLGHAFCEVRDSKGNSILAPRKTLYIDDICVDENARGRGVGRKLFEHVEKLAQEEGDFEAITLNVWNFNRPAYDFYMEMGFEPLHTILEKKLK